MTLPRFGLLVTAFVLFLGTTGAADPPTDQYGDALPKGAKARLGTVRGGPPVDWGFSLLAPDYTNVLVPGDWWSNPRLHNLTTGKATELALTLNRRGRWDGRLLDAVSADGKRAVFEEEEGKLLVWDIAGGKSVQTLTMPAGWKPSQTSTSLSADGKVVAAASTSFTPGKGSKGAAVVWNVEKNEIIAELTVLQNGTVSVVLSPDGKRLATYGTQSPGATVPPNTVSPTRMVQVWDVATGKQLAAIDALADAVDFRLPRNPGAVTFSADGKTLATSPGNGTVRLWDAASGELTHELLGRPYQGVRVAFSPDGKTVASVGRNGSIDRWSLPDGRALKRTDFPNADERLGPAGNLIVTGLAFTDNERVIAWGRAWNQRLLIWEAPSGKPLTPLGEHLAAVRAVQFTRDGKEAVTAGDDMRVMRWNPETGKATVPVRLHTQDGPTYLTHIGPGATRALRAGLVCDLSTEAEQFTFTHYVPSYVDPRLRATTIPPHYVTPSPDFTRAASLLAPRKPNGPVRCFVWDLDARRKLHELELPAATDLSEASVAFSPDGTRMVSAVRVNERGVGALDKPLVVTGWDLKTGKKLAEFNEPRGSKFVEIAAGSNTACVIATDSGSLWAADYERGVAGDEIDQSRQRDMRITVPTFSPDGKRFAAGVPTGNGRECAVRVYDWPRGKLLHTFEGHTGPITTLAFSWDGKTLASGSEDTTVLLWDLSVVQPK